MNERIIDLINRLIKNTEQGQVEWQRTSRDNEFKIDLKNGAVSTDSWTDDNTLELIDFRVYNIIGDQIGSWVLSSSEDGYDLIKELHSTVNRKYLRIDETLDGMLEELEKK